MADIVLMTGDTAPLTRTLYDGNNAVVDLTGATLKFWMQLVGSRLTKVDAAAVVVTPLLGAVRYDWGTADVDQPGLFKGLFRVTFASGKKQSFPNGRYLKVLIQEHPA